MGNLLTTVRCSQARKKLILRGHNSDSLGRKSPATITSNISREFPLQNGVWEILNAQPWFHKPLLTNSNWFPSHYKSFYSGASVTLKGAVRRRPRKAEISLAPRAVMSHHAGSRDVHSLSWVMSVCKVLSCNRRQLCGSSTWSQDKHPLWNDSDRNTLWILLTDLSAIESLHMMYSYFNDLIVKNLIFKNVSSLKYSSLLQPYL